MALILQPKVKWKPRPEWPVVYPSLKWYSWGNCRVMVGLEPVGWHLSISCPNRNPTWAEIKQARYDLLPHDVTMAMILPPASEYVSIHNFCFHLFQITNEGTANDESSK